MDLMRLNYGLLSCECPPFFFLATTRGVTVTSLNWFASSAVFKPRTSSLILYV